MFGGSSSLPTTTERRFVVGSSRKLGWAAEHLIDGSEKHIRRFGFEF